MAYGILIQEKVAALNIDSLNRSVVSASAMENGMVINLLAKSTNSGSTVANEVWTAEAPVTGSLIDLWIIYEPEVVITTSGNSSYKGIDCDPRNFIIPAGTVFSAFKPQMGDLLMFNYEGLSGSRSTGDYVVAANGDNQLAWSAAPAANALSLKYTDSSYISIGTGAIDSQRVTAYRFQVIQID